MAKEYWEVEAVVRIRYLVAKGVTRAEAEADLRACVNTRDLDWRGGQVEWIEFTSIKNDD